MGGPGGPADAFWSGGVRRHGKLNRRSGTVVGGQLRRRLWQLATMVVALVRQPAAPARGVFGPHAKVFRVLCQKGGHPTLVLRTEASWHYSSTARFGPTARRLCPTPGRTSPWRCRAVPIVGPSLGGGAAAAVAVQVRLHRRGALKAGRPQVVRRTVHLRDSTKPPGTHGPTGRHHVRVDLLRVLYLTAARAAGVRGRGVEARLNAY